MEVDEIIEKTQRLFEEEKYAEALETIKKGCDSNFGDGRLYSLYRLKSICEEAINSLDEAFESISKAKELLKGRGLPDEESIDMIYERIRHKRLEKSGIRQISVKGLFDETHYAKLKSNRKVAEYLEDPIFIRRLIQFKEDPSCYQHFKSDKRIMEAMNVLLGIDSGSDDSVATIPIDGLVGMNVNDDKVNLEEALREKELGNEQYRKGMHALALEHYNRAIDFDPENHVYPLNASAAHFEGKSYEKAIEMAKKSLQLMSATQPKRLFYSKAYYRVGVSQSRLGRHDEAIEYLERAQKLLEQPLSGPEKEMIRKIRKELYMCKLAGIKEIRREAKEQFEKKKYSNAKKSYTKAIDKLLAIHPPRSELKRDNEASQSLADFYVARGEVFMRISRWKEARQDFSNSLRYVECFETYKRIIETLIKEKGPKYLEESWKVVNEVKAKIREGLLREEMDAANRLENWIKAERRLAVESEIESEEKEMERFMRDPELRAIISDREFMMKIEELNKFPASQHVLMRDPEMRSRIEKLVKAGILK